MYSKPICFGVQIDRFVKISRTGQLAVHVPTARQKGVKSFLKPTGHTSVAFQHHNIGRSGKSRHTTSCAVYDVEEEARRRIESRSSGMGLIQLFRLPLNYCENFIVVKHCLHITNILDCKLFVQNMNDSYEQPRQ